jgi:hypothetical protein
MDLCHRPPSASMAMSDDNITAYDVFPLIPVDCPVIGNCNPPPVGGPDPQAVALPHDGGGQVYADAQWPTRYGSRSSRWRARKVPGTPRSGSSRVRSTLCSAPSSSR